jgi:glycosyltransferase involved in cell wall biosynthesis
MRREELRSCPLADLNLVVSQTDQERLNTVAPQAATWVVPNGVDTEYFAPDSTEIDEETVLFVGGATWFPNLDAMEYLVDDILPVLREIRQATRVTWVGHADASTRRRFERRGIEMTGYVGDIRPYLNRATCVIAPLRVGGGTRLKILDAWAMGKAVVSTSVGCEGLQVSEGANILIADEPLAFAESVVRIMRDPHLRGQLERAARQTALETYDWCVIGTTLREAYRHLLESTS